MTRAALRVAVLASLLACAAACSRTPSAGQSAPAIRLTTPPSGPAFVEVTGVPRDVLLSLQRARLSVDRWTSVLRVAVDAQSPPVVGTYAIKNDAITFTPLFPFDPGRQYDVRFDPSALGGDEGARPAPLVATVGLPRRDAAPSTTVIAIYPTGDVLPENQLRMYVEFSAPMSMRSGIEYLSLLDEKGATVEGAFLPLDYEFWNRDRTRFTIFFDPGRVKRGILPNRQMGRALQAGHTYRLVASPEWRDGNGLPLKEGYSRTFRVGPADTSPIDPATWRFSAPAAGSRSPLLLMFPEPMDYGLLSRALAVRKDGQVLDGEITIAGHETQWTFTPQNAWVPGNYDLLALSILEDRAGNQIGRAFEVDNFDTVDKDPDPKTVTLPFRIQ